MTDVDVVYNPFEPGFTADPYPHYDELREHQPVCQTPIGFWLLFRYDDAFRFLRDPKLSVEERHATPGPLDTVMEDILGDRADRFSSAMLNRDAPDHTRLRRLVSKAFTPQAIERLRPRIQTWVDEALDRVEPDGEMDLIADLAFPLPFTVISEMLGMPEVDRAKLREWSGLLVRTLEPLFDTDLMRAIADAGDSMSDLLMGIIEDKRRHPADDLLSALIAAEDEGDVLSDDELLSQLMLLYIAGHETTVNLIGNGTLALLRNPAELDRWHHDPTLDRNAVEELLRYDPPVQMSRRIVREDVEVGGHTIEAGSFVAVVLASANRDRAHWGETADQLDLTRGNAHDHLSFGGGAHHCLGAALARLEAQIALGTLIRRFPGIELAGEPEWNGRINLRGLDRLPLSLGKRQSD
ncbi:MAG: cytochrome P450 [Acidimicrobiales bacterium]